MKIKAILALIALLTGVSAQAQGLGNILKGLGGDEGLGSTIGNVVQGIFTKSDLKLEDIVGEYKSEGPAVTFKSDNFLQKAGGIAGAAAIESKLQPYYEKYGLIGMPLTIDKESKFTMTIKGIKLSGDVKRNDDGTFTFNFKMAGAMKLGQFTAYIEKSGSTLKLMFDATKLKDLISAVGKMSGMSVAKTVGSVLDGYDGLCVGFKMSYTGAASGTDATAGQGTSDSQSNDNGLGNLINKLGKKKK